LEGEIAMQPKITWEVPGGQGVHTLPDGAEITIKVGHKSITICVNHAGEICVREVIGKKVQMWHYPKGKYPESVFLEPPVMR
jgi:hypothetical protein